MVILITGMAGSGKSSIAKKLKKAINNSIIIDGDEIREIFNNNKFDDEGREENIMIMGKIASLLEKQGFTPIISAIMPRKIWRKKIRKIFNESILIYLSGGSLWENTFYEIPDKEEL